MYETEMRLHYVCCRATHWAMTSRVSNIDSHYENLNAVWICYGPFDNTTDRDECYENNKDKYAHYEHIVFLSIIKFPRPIQKRLIKRQLKLFNRTISASKSKVTLIYEEDHIRIPALH